MDRSRENERLRLCQGRRRIRTTQRMERGFAGHGSRLYVKVSLFSPLDYYELNLPIRVGQQ